MATITSLNYYQFAFNGFAFGGSMPTYWLNHDESFTGLNLFVDCNNFNAYVNQYTIIVGSSTHFGPVISNLLLAQNNKKIDTESSENIEIEN